MTGFLKLTSMLINTKHIHKILIQPNKYYIYLSSNSSNNGFSGFTLWGTGMISSNNNETYCEVCETKHSIDYKIVSEWINNQK